MSQSKKISTLVLVRHGQSQWNKENLFTGWKDPDLTEKGIEEAINAGKKIKQTNINFHTFHFKTKELKGQVISSCKSLEKISPRLKIKPLTKETMEIYLD